MIRLLCRTAQMGFSATTIVAATLCLLCLPASRAGAQASGQVAMVRFALATGEDDLKAGRKAVGRLAYLKASGREDSIPFQNKHGQAFANFTSVWADAPLPNDVPLQALTWLMLDSTFEMSGRGDNWNPDAAYVTALVSAGGRTQDGEIFRRIGNPLHHFEADRNRRYPARRSPQPAQSASGPVVRFTSARFTNEGGALWLNATIHNSGPGEAFFKALCTWKCPAGLTISGGAVVAPDNRLTQGKTGSFMAPASGMCDGPPAVLDIQCRVEVKSGGTFHWNARLPTR